MCDRFVMCYKNGGVLDGPFLSYETTHHTFCHMPSLASFAIRPTMQISVHYLAHFAQFSANHNIVNRHRSAMLHIPKYFLHIHDRAPWLCLCRFWHLHSCGVIFTRKSGMSPLSTTLQTMDVCLLVPTKVQ